MILPLTYTLCFLRRNDHILMLHRRKPPNQGLWNGVGGRIEAGESPLQACLREVREETSYLLHAARFAGVLTWRGFETIADGGLYLFTADAPPGDPLACDEGELRWLSIDWVLSAREVVSNIPLFGPHIFNGEPPRRHHFDYRDREIMRYEICALPEFLSDRLSVYAKRVSNPDSRL